MTKAATQIEQERARLDGALDRLETVVKSVSARAQQQLVELRGQRDKLTADLAAVQTEHARTVQKLAAAETDNAALERAIGAVTGRIDATIEQLQSALEE